MPAKKKNNDLNLTTLAPLFVDEDKAREWLERKRWPNGPVCPRCGSKDIYTITPKKPGTTTRKGVYKCKACRKAKESCQFTVRIGTIFEESRLPISKWLMAIHLMCSSKKGVSSHQIARELDITQKSAWFMCHRIREAMTKEPMASMLGGPGKTLEADETYVGARKLRHPGTSKRGRGTKKQPVLALVERDGEVRTAPVKTVNKKNIRETVLQAADRSSRLITDEAKVYTKLGREFEGGHEVVKHSDREYVRRNSDVHSNTVESFFALLKRGHYGTFHQLSKRHLHRYCNEFSFRWNHRKVSDGQRMLAAIAGAEGKRLKYKSP